MALPLVLHDYRRVGAQSGDLSLGVDMEDVQLPSRIFTSDPVGGALRSGRPLSVDASTVRKGTARSGRSGSRGRTNDVAPVSHGVARAWCWAAHGPKRLVHAPCTDLAPSGPTQGGVNYQNEAISKSRAVHIASVPTAINSDCGVLGSGSLFDMTRALSNALTVRLSPRSRPLNPFAPRRERGAGA
jgi:hypothetical protein